MRTILLSDLSVLSNIASIDLSEIRSMQGSLVPLEACKNLQKLNLNNTSVHGSFDVLARITTLTWLSIRGCSHIDCTRALEKGHLNLLGHSPFCNLKNLQYIDVSETNMTGMISTEEISFISRIRREYGPNSVHMNFCGKMVITPDWRISKLLDINLGGILSLECSLSPFALCKKRLCHLNLSDCGGIFDKMERCYKGGVSGSLAPLEGLDALESLNLRYCYGIQGEITPGVVRLISHIRAKYGRSAVDLRNCGQFYLSKDMTSIEDIEAIDLSEIQSLSGDSSGVLTFATN